MTQSLRDDVRICRPSTALDDEEEQRCRRLSAPFLSLCRRYLSRNRGAGVDAMVEALERDPRGLAAFRRYEAAVALADFPKAKRRLVAQLVRRHAPERTLIIVPRIEDAFAIAMQDPVDVVLGARASEEQVARFRDGRLRILASSRVLDNDDLAPVRVGILTSANHISEEARHRFRRALRSRNDAPAILYELTTASSFWGGDDLRGASPTPAPG